MKFDFPKVIQHLIHVFAAYHPEPWLFVAEHQRGDYGWLPQNEMVGDLIALPGC
jgi:hypothetical protein